MAKKKTFLGNPALQFISTGDYEPEQQDTNRESRTAPAKKTAPEGKKPNPLYIETKSRRLQLLMQPSLFERVKSGAEQAGQSVNDFISTILNKALK